MMKKKNFKHIAMHRSLHHDDAGGGVCGRYQLPVSRIAGTTVTSEMSRGPILRWHCIYKKLKTGIES